MNRIKSTDTVSEICMNLCGSILKHLSEVVLHGQPVMSHRVDTISTMIVWYIGILCRACPDDLRYKGLPKVTLAYLEQHEIAKEHATRHAFTMDTLEKVPVHLLVELVHRTVRHTVASLVPNVSNMTVQKANQWSSRITDLLPDLSEALDLTGVITESGLNSAMVRIHLQDGLTDVRDFV